MKTFSLSFQYNVLVNEVVNCMNEITQWMHHHLLKINPDKTELLLLYPKSMSNGIVIHGTIFEDQCIRFSESVKNVGVWLDMHLNLETHVNKIVSHCYKLLKDISIILSVLSRKHTEMLIHAVISSRLDYCNSIFFNMDKSNLYKLQKVQNAAARLIVQKRRTESMRDTLKELHWLRVESRIIFKILLLVHKCMRGICSKNLKIDYKTHNCRPNDYLLLKTRCFNTKYGKRTFDYAGPRLWNALPIYIRTEENLDNFKRMVKTILFEDTEGFKQRSFMYN